jgi:hypothetical protein
MRIFVEMSGLLTIEYSYLGSRTAAGASFGGGGTIPSGLQFIELMMTIYDAPGASPRHCGPRQKISVELTGLLTIEYSYLGS